MKHPAAWCAAAALVVLFACSSNNGNGFPFSGPSCQPQVGTCFDCYEQSCDGSCLASACADFFSCFCACSPTDQSCLQGCFPKAETQSCVQCASNVDQNSCQQACSSQCGSSSMSGSGGFGSSSGGGSPISCEATDGSLCMTFQGASTTCPSSTTMVASCPSANELGACAITATGSAGSSATVTEYYYCAGAFATSGTSASMFQMACTSASNGMWTPGSVTQCGDGGATSSSSGGGSGSSSGGGSSSGSGSSSGGPADGGTPTCNSVPCGDAGQSMQYCEIDQGGVCTQAWYQVGNQVFDCIDCSASGCMAAEQAAVMACP